MAGIMATSGWVKLHRELLDKALFRNEKLLKVFIWCLLKATHEEYDQLVGRQVVHLMPGQFVTGRHKGSAELNLKPSTFWDYLYVLKSNRTIDIKSNNKNSVITVVNWELYQSRNGNSDSKSDRISDSESDSKSDTNKKKEIKNNIYSDDFETFYKVYPNPKGKAQTYKNWKKVIKQHDPNEIIECAKRYQKSLRPDTEKAYITTSYNFLGQKQAYLDYLQGSERDQRQREHITRDIFRFEE